MIRRPPRSTRTDTLFPYTTLFRSDSSLRVRRLEGIKSHILASPSHLAQRGRPTHPAQLSQHAFLGYAYNDAPDIWRFLGPDREEVAIRPAGSLRSNSGDAMLPALCAGLGIAILPDFIVRPHLEAGRLETILEEWLPPPMSLHLLRSEEHTSELQSLMRISYAVF